MHDLADIYELLCNYEFVIIHLVIKISCLNRSQTRYFSFYTIWFFSKFIPFHFKKGR
jgi:hypothetical protein